MPIPPFRPCAVLLFNFTFTGRNIACGGAQCGGEKTCQSVQVFLKKKSTLEKQTWIYVVHYRTMKIVMYTMKPRLRASPRHGGQGVFFE